MYKVKGPFTRLASFVEDKLVILKVDIPPPEKFPFVGQIIIEEDNDEGIEFRGVIREIIPNCADVRIKVIENNHTESFVCKHKQIVSIRVFHEKEVTESIFIGSRKKEGTSKNRRKETWNPD